jgi:6-pyruvoyltetrahydropterin/6-carboxytetrahydropterin synthase
MYTVTREIHFCYGHRILGHQGKCRHLHGHNGRLEVTLFSNTLNALGMVRDFDDIREIIQSWVDEFLDHNMILFKDDPLIPILEELGERHYAIDKNPTAEVICKLVFDYALSKDLPLRAVRLWEGPKSYATYEA